MSTIIFSVLGLIVTYFVAFRDRVALKAVSNILIKHANGRDFKVLHIHIVNTGRRQVYLQSLVLVKGNQVESVFLVSATGQDYHDHFHGYILLEEGEAHDIYVSVDAPYKVLLHDDITPADSLYIEDTTGQRYPVKRSKFNLQKLFITSMF